MVGVSELRISSMKIICGTCLKNEEGRVLREWLEHASLWADGIVVLDDGSTDNSREICLEFPKVLEVHTQHLPRNEGRDRQTLWDLLMKYDPEWCVLLDADEIFEDKIVNFFGQLRQVVDVPEDIDIVFSFPMCHFWKSKTHFRVDGVWDPDRVLAEGRVVKSRPGLVYPPFPEHVSNIPYRSSTLDDQINYDPLPITRVPGIRIRHYSFIGTEDEHRQRYQERMERNAEAYSWAQHINPDANYEDGMELVEWPNWWREPTKI